VAITYISLIVVVSTFFFEPAMHLNVASVT